MHFEILDAERLSLLENLCEQVDLQGFYLAGGTGLSLQMNLRKSYDFDFFMPDTFNPDLLYHSVSALYPDGTYAVTLSRGTCDLTVKGIRVRFFEYPYPLIENPVVGDRIKNLQLAGIPDIAAMKMTAIGGRGAKKDFFDLYQIITKTGMSAKQLMSYLKRKYGSHFNYSYMIMGLDFFEDAEGERLPELFVDFDWNEAKRFFIRMKKELIDSVYTEFDPKNRED